MTPTEKAILNRLQNDDDLWEALTNDHYDWDFQPDASYDDGRWSDDSLWLSPLLPLYGHLVILTALPDYDWYDKDSPGIGEIHTVRIVGVA